jgi:murein L,D-transpeptidase YcbB/YkuD
VSYYARVRRRGAVAVLIALFPAGSSLGAREAADLEPRIRQRIERFDPRRGLRIGNETIHASSALGGIYAAREYSPIWSVGDRLLPLADELLDAVRDASSEGLDPLDYHLDRILNLRLAAEHRGLNPPTDLLVDLDFLLTDAFLVYAGHLAEGAVNPVTIDPEWFIKRREVDLVSIFERAAGTGTIEETLRGLAPSQPEYTRLREALSRYRDLARRASVPLLRGGSSIEPGARDGRVRGLRARLAIALDDSEVPPPLTETDFYDPDLVEAVRAIQRRYGLHDDGIVGGATREALNRDPAELAAQIEVNMERWRWLPDDLGSRHLLVNIAGFDLRAMEEGKTALAMRVVVGQPYRRTPVLSTRVTHIAVNPSWTVPETIAKEDVIPAVRKDVAFLERMHLRVFDGWSESAPELDPKRIDWSEAAPLRYRFRQEPGPWSPLGRVKFVLSDSHDVYLHDTPDRKLFARATRGFSSGCIRLEEPFALLDYLLKHEPPATAERVEEARAGEEERILALAEPWPIHILYWTAWVDDHGEVNFRNDLYRRDEPVLASLHARPPR